MNWLIDPNIIALLITGAIAVAGWIFKDIVLTALLHWIHAPIIAKAEQIEAKIMARINEMQAAMSVRMTRVDTELSHLRTNGAAFSDRVANIEDRIQQGAVEVNDLRRRVEHNTDKINENKSP